MATFEFDVPITAEELREAFIANFARRRQRVRDKSLLRIKSGGFAAVVLLEVGILVIAWYNNDRLILWLIGGMLGALLALLAIAILLTRIRIWIAWRKQEAALSKIGERRMMLRIRVADAGLTMGNEKEVPWSQFEEIVERPGRWLLMGKHGLFLELPTEGLHEGILDFIRSRITVWGSGG